MTERSKANKQAVKRLRRLAEIPGGDADSVSIGYESGEPDPESEKKYDDGSSDWDYSTNGHFESVSGQRTTLDLDKILRNAVQTWGKEKQTDMMIEEMAELTKEILNERRGREHNIAEEMADAQIMLAQMEIIFQNSKEVGRIFWEKIARLDQRLRDRKEKRADE